MTAGAISFLGAFLLFFLQPFIAKVIAPWFGGGNHVWLTCMLFFQAVLLAGYAYAHLLLTRASPRVQGHLHRVVLGLALASLAWTFHASGLPLVPASGSSGAAGVNPPLAVLRVLVTGVGLCALPLAASSPLAQAWFLRTGGGNPFRLYALSNAGSLLGLLAYPFLVEPFLPLKTQAWAAATLVVLYVALMARLSAKAMDSPDLGPSRPEDGGEAGASPWAWGFIALTGTVLLMAVTNLLTTELSGVPLLWVLPLVIYLLTFILAFDGKLDLEGPWAQGLTLGVFLLTLLLIPAATRLPGLTLLTALLLTTLFTGCLLCNCRLHALRPHPSRLSAFYLTLALGGVLGGIAVSVLAPLVFNRIHEFPLAVTLVGLVAVLGARPPRAPGWVALAGCLALTLTGLVRNAQLPDRSYRDFYGQIKVASFGGGALKVMFHGRTVHGLERMDAPLLPVAYYQDHSGIALALARLRRVRPTLRIGVVGLGVGNVLAHAVSGDQVRIYEISPEVIRLAGHHGREFTVVDACPARCEILPGDGRHRLGLEPPQGFDLLFLDAFSGGNVPASLLTLEAMKDYGRHLAPGGLLVLNVTNRLPVDRLVLANAKALGLGALAIVSPGRENPAPLGPLQKWSSFILLGKDPAMLLDPALVQPARAIILPPLPPGTLVDPSPEFLRRVAAGDTLAGGVRPWTDDFNSLTLLLMAGSANLEARPPASAPRGRAR
ncbi:fused MFS/spermidine synthase [Mesoterricola silvestris]|nr:fused MFS/spermidine synthase [Mesoterricola silvestris]